MRSAARWLWVPLGAAVACGSPGDGSEAGGNGGPEAREPHVTADAPGAADATAPDSGGAPAGVADADRLPSGAGADGSDSIAPAPSAGAGEPPFPPLPGEGEPRIYRLLLVNALESEATVYASAGARRVVLDTVPARDSVRVDIRMRADEVDLEARDPRGYALAETTLELAAAGPNRWVIDRRREAVRVALARASLVRRDRAGYPRWRPHRRPNRR